jgi:hypothetical protein
MNRFFFKRTKFWIVSEWDTRFFFVPSNSFFCYPMRLLFCFCLRFPIEISRKLCDNHFSKTSVDKFFRSCLTFLVKLEDWGFFTLSNLWKHKSWDNLLKECEFVHLLMLLHNFFSWQSNLLLGLEDKISFGLRYLLILWKFSLLNWRVWLDGESTTHRHPSLDWYWYWL